MKANNKTTKRSITNLLIISAIITGCLVSGCLDDGQDELSEQNSDTASGTWTPPQQPYVKSIDTSKLKLGEPSDATITVFNNGNEIITKEKIVMTATAVKLDSWAANLVLKTKSGEEKTETYELEFNERIESGESCTLCAEFDLPAKVSGVSIAGIYHVAIEVYADDTLIGTKTMDLHLKA